MQNNKKKNNDPLKIRNSYRMMLALSMHDLVSRVNNNTLTRGKIFNEKSSLLISKLILCGPHMTVAYIKFLWEISCTKNVVITQLLRKQGKLKNFVWKCLSQVRQENNVGSSRFFRVSLRLFQDGGFRG